MVQMEIDAAASFAGRPNNSDILPDKILIPIAKTRSDGQTEFTASAV